MQYSQFNLKKWYNRASKGVPALRLTVGYVTAKAICYMSSIPSHFTCTKCGSEYPLTKEFFSKDIKYKTGFTTRCRQCAKEYNAQHYQKTKPKRKTQHREWATNNPEKMLEYSRKYYWAHRDEIRSREKLDRKNNPQKYRGYQQTRRKKDGGASLRAAVARWQKANPERAIYQSQVRRARHRSLPHTFTIHQWEQCLEYWGHSCAICGKSPDFWTTLAQGHWIALSDPRADNPGTVAHNVIPICHTKPNGALGMPSCNNSMQAKDPIEWLNTKYGKRQSTAILERIYAYFALVTT